MGRYYNGDIEGKFWFGIQGSDDIENLISIEPYTFYIWKICNCAANIEDNDYCSDCYESKNEHIEEAIDEEEYEDGCLYYESGSSGYSLDKETHYNKLLDSMNTLKKNINIKIMEEFDKIEQNDKILNAFTGVFDKIIKVLFKNNFKNEAEKNNQEVLVGRYTLGYQIEYCLRTTGSCNINCES